MVAVIAVGAAGEINLTANAKRMRRRHSSPSPHPPTDRRLLHHPAPRIYPRSPGIRRRRQADPVTFRAYRLTLISILSLLLARLLPAHCRYRLAVTLTHPTSKRVMR